MKRHSITDTADEAATPTQTAHPWRATGRTVFAFVVAVAAIWATVVEAAGVDDTGPIIAATIAVAGGITRVMALPGVNDLFIRFLPILAAEPSGTGETAVRVYEHDKTTPISGEFGETP